MFTKGAQVYFLELAEGASSFNFMMPYEDAQDVVNFIQATPRISIKNHGEGIAQEKLELQNVSLRDMENLDLPTDEAWKVNFQGAHPIMVDGTCRYSSKLIQLAKGEIEEEVVVAQSEAIVEQVVQADPKQSAKDAFKAKLAQTQEKPIVTQSVVQVGPGPGPVVGQAPMVTAGPAPDRGKNPGLESIRQQTLQQASTHVSPPVVGNPVTVGSAVQVPMTRQVSSQIKKDVFNPVPTQQKSKMERIYDLLLSQQQDNQELLAEVKQLRAEVQQLTQALYQ
ncbi:hypothetical protein_gp207 [Bacillus phage vB_BceM_WH1]|nr:hypothetical protein_gp207 [Bacillus phage vB_BceM_WH1]